MADATEDPVGTGPSVTERWGYGPVTVETVRVLR